MTDEKRRMVPKNPQKARDERVYGVNACLAVARVRPRDIKRVYLTAARLAAFKELLATLARDRKPYDVVRDEDIAKVADAVHHEGVCFVVAPRQEPTLDALDDRVARVRLVYLDAVDNPHNLGAILRVAAHFGAGAVLVEPSLRLGPAATRIAEGAAEIVPVIPVTHGELARLASRGFALLATDPRAEHDAFTAQLAPRVVFLLGSERAGLSRDVRALATASLRIPGTGQVESLNVATASAVLLGEHYRRGA